jgi:hypothetical protein
VKLSASPSMYGSLSDKIVRAVRRTMKPTEFFVVK